MKRRIRSIILGLLAVSIAVLVARHYLWFRSYKVQVSCAGQRIANAHVYRNGEDVLLVLRNPAPGAYVISRRENALGVPMSGFWLKTGVVIGLDDGSVVWMKASERYDPKLRLAETSADFEDFGRQSYHLQW